VKSKEHCPFFKYGQCIIAPPHIAYSIVNLERCSKYYKTCKYYLKHVGEASGKSKSRDIHDKNKSLLQFIDRNEAKLITVGYYSSRNSMKERRRKEKLISEVLEMILKDSQGS